MKITISRDVFHATYFDKFHFYEVYIDMTLNNKLGSLQTNHIVIHKNRSPFAYFLKTNLYITLYFLHVSN